MEKHKISKEEIEKLRKSKDLKSLRGQIIRKDEKTRNSTF